MKRLLLFASMASLTLYSCSKATSGGGDSKASFASEGGGSSSGGNAGDSTLQAGVITAGEWSDLTNWSFWTNLQTRDTLKDIKEELRYPLQVKITVKLLTNNNELLVDEPVQLKSATGAVVWSARTDNKGIAQLFLTNAQAQAASGFQLLASDRGTSGTVTTNNNIQEVKLGVSVNNITNADIAFVVDATGSMGDEISYLKNELLDVITRVRSAHPDIALRTGAVFYRDEGDDYVTKQSAFSTNTSTVVNFIKGQEAGGGGDFPEAVHTAMKEAVEQLSWSAQARSRIIFLILDAPPHDGSSVHETLKKAVYAAAQKGIRVIPITASGINLLTEYLMRQIAIATNGTYVFITNHSGIGNEHLEPTVGKYEVEYLNNLMVRLINASLQ